MSALSGLAKSTFIYGVGNVLPQIIGFFLIPLYTVYLSPRDYGIVDLATTLSGFLTPLMRFGIPGSVTRYYFDFKGDDQKINDYITTIYILLLLASAVVGVLFSVVYIFFGDRIVPELLFFPFVFLILLTAIFSSNSDLQRRLIVARGQAKFSATLSFLFSLISIGLTLLLVVTFELAAVGIILAQAITALLFFVHAQLYLGVNLRGTFDFALAKEAFSYGMGMLPHHLFVAFAPLFSKFLLAGFSSVGSLGVLAIAMRFILPLDFLYNAFIPSFHPMYFEERLKNTIDSQQNLIQLQKQIFALTLICYMTYSLVIPIIIPLVVDIRYVESAGYVSILALGFVGRMFYANFIVEIFYIKKTQLVSITTVIGLFVTIGLSVVFIGHGAKGIAYANSFGFLVWAAVAFALVRLRKAPSMNVSFLITCLLTLLFSFVILEVAHIPVLLKALLLLPICVWLWYDVGMNPFLKKIARRK